jgi:hypothetical protein
MSDPRQHSDDVEPIEEPPDADLDFAAIEAPPAEPADVSAADALAAAREAGVA